MKSIVRDSTTLLFESGSNDHLSDVLCSQKGKDACKLNKMTCKSELFTFRHDFCRVRDYSLSWRVFLCATKRLRLKVQLCQWHQINCFSPVNDRSQVERSACISLCKNDLRTIKSECIDQWCAFFSSYVFETWRRNVEYVFKRITVYIISLGYVLNFLHSSMIISPIIYQSHQIRNNTKEKFRDQIISGTRRENMSNVKNIKSLWRCPNRCFCVLFPVNHVKYIVGWSSCHNVSQNNPCITEHFSCRSIQKIYPQRQA